MSDYEMGDDVPGLGLPEEIGYIQGCVHLSHRAVLGVGCNLPFQTLP